MKEESRGGGGEEKQKERTRKWEHKKKEMKVRLGLLWEVSVVRRPCFLSSRCSVSGTENQWFPSNLMNFSEGT